MLSHVTVEALGQFKLFDNLNQETLEQIAPLFSSKLYHRNEIIYSPNTEAHHFIFVLKGKIKISRLSELGKEHIIRIIGPKEFTGELALFEGTRKSQAIALIATEIFAIQHQQFKNILEQHPSLALKMIELLALRLHSSEEQSVWLSTSTAKDRLLIYLNKKAKTVGDKRIAYHQETKRFMAGYLGMSTETLSRVITQLEQEGKIIDYQNHFIELL